MSSVDLKDNNEYIIELYDKICKDFEGISIVFDSDLEIYDTVKNYTKDPDIQEKINIMLDKKFGIMTGGVI